MRIVSLMAAAALGSGATCVDVSTSNCATQEFFSVPGTVTINTPVKCPMYIGHDGQPVRFGAAVRIQDLTNSGDISVFNYNGTMVMFAAMGFFVDWNDPNDFYDDESYGDFNIEYPAATSGRYWTSYDVGVVNFTAVGSGAQQANVYLTYYGDSPIQIAGPGEILAWEDFTVSASFHDPSFVLPVTKQWALNGQALPDTGWAVSGNSGAQGTQFQYVLTVTSASGQTVSNFYSFYTKLCDFEGCNDQRRVGPAAPAGSPPVRTRRGGS